MDISIGQALLIALWSAFMFSGPIFTPLMGMFKPMFSGLVIGLVLGDVKTGLIAGGLFDLAYLGFGRAGGANPPSNIAPGIFGLIWVVRSGMDPQIALALSFPIAIFIAFMQTLVFTLCAPWAKLVAPAYKKSPKIGYNFVCNGTLIALMLIGIVMGVLACYTSDSINDALRLLPQWIMDTFKVAGNLLPGVGFAIILSIMLKKVYFPFALLGYFGFSYMNLTTIGLVIMATIVALIVLFSEKAARNLINNKMDEISSNNLAINGGVQRGI